MINTERFPNRVWGACALDRRCPSIVQVSIAQLFRKLTLIPCRLSPAGYTTSVGP